MRAQNGSQPSLSEHPLSEYPWHSYGGDKGDRIGKGTALPSRGGPPLCPTPKPFPESEVAGASLPSEWTNLSPGDSRACSPCQPSAVMPESRNAPSRSLQALLQELMHHSRKINTCHKPGSGAHPAGARICKHRGATRRLPVPRNELDCSLLKMGCEGGPGGGVPGGSPIWPGGNGCRPDPAFPPACVSAAPVDSPSSLSCSSPTMLFPLWVPRGRRSSPGPPIWPLTEGEGQKTPGG